MQNRAALLTLAVFWPICIPGSAGENPDMSVGDKVRISLAQGRAVGALGALDERTLTLKDLKTAEITAYSLNEVRLVEVSRGRHSHWRNAGKGALIGGSIGATAGMVEGACHGNTHDCGGAWLVVEGGALGAAGALLGALAGATLSPGEAWRMVHLKGVRAVATPMRGGAQFWLTVAF